MTLRFPRPRASWSLGLVLIAAFVAGRAAPGDEQSSPPITPPEAALEAAAVDTCAGCHDPQIASFRGGPHAFLEASDPQRAIAGGCAACHGDATAHVDSGGETGNIFAFSDDDFAIAKSTRCLDCHSDSHPSFLRSRHAAAGLDCSTCHSAHSSDPNSRFLLKPLARESSLPRASASCESCHGDVFASFEFNERHRLQEGILTCASCHDPHEPQSRLHLGGFKQAACVSCHSDKEGPFVFEHGSQRVEGCSACHTPHGSPNRHLLTFQSVADLCYSCHVAVPGFHTRFTADTVCTNCHSTIHGSNFDAAFLK